MKTELDPEIMLQVAARMLTAESLRADHYKEALQAIVDDRYHQGHVCETCAIARSALRD